jgi:hypothetical protein
VASGINCAISTMYKTVHNGGICIRYERRRGEGWHTESLRIIVILRNYVEYLFNRIHNAARTQQRTNFRLDKRVVYVKETITDIMTV